MKFTIGWKGKFYDCEWIDTINFESLDRVLGVHGFVFDKLGKVGIIKFKDKDHWTPMGGKPEEIDKSFEDTFIREVDEEASLDIKNIKRIGAIKIIPRHNPEDKHYQVRFAAEVKKIKPMKIDPAKNEIPERIFIDPKEFNNYCKWQTNGDFQIRKAVEAINLKSTRFK